MTKWNPDIDEYEFNRIQAITVPYAGWRMLTEDPFQYGAWFEDGGGTKHIRMPWKKARLPDGTPTCPDGQTILAHNTHLQVLEYLHPHHDSILDVGGYDGIWAWLISAQRKVVLDICQEALERWAAIHSDIICADGRDLGKLFQKDEFDVVFLLDVLEHMRATSALKCLKAAEEIAKYQVMVATPDGWWPFDNYECIITPGADVPCVELMAHKSGWGHGFFESRGYEVTIQPGLHSDLGMGDGLVAVLNK